MYSSFFTQTMTETEVSVDLTEDDLIILDPEEKISPQKDEVKRQEKTEKKTESSSALSEEEVLWELPAPDMDALEDLIDSKLLELGFDNKAEKAVGGISKMISAQESMCFSVCSYEIDFF